jgi:hypothetical protein
VTTCYSVNEEIAIAFWSRQRHPKLGSAMLSKAELKLAKIDAIERGDYDCHDEETNL